MERASIERNPIERILCPVDFSKYSVQAYAYACSLAQRYGAKLFVQNVVELWRHPSASFAAAADLYAQFCADLTDEGKEHLQRFVEVHSPAGFFPECVTGEGMAIDCILGLAQQENVDLIVMGTHGVRGFDRLILGSVTEKVLRKAKCSVLAVHRGTRQPGEGGMALREILFCTDFSAAANGAMGTALSMAGEYGARLTLIHVLEGMARLHNAENTAKAYERLDRMVPESMRRERNIDTVVRAGKACREISQLASERSADLVMMGVQGSHALDDTMFGSTTYRVVQMGQCPVLAVHPWPPSGKTMRVETMAGASAG
jgi:nucleotide-binding universal stress UspA family protein